MPATIIEFFPYLVAREKMKRRDPEQQRNAIPVVTLFARHLLLDLKEPWDDLTVAWALGFIGISNMTAMEMWVTKQLLTCSFQLTTEQQLSALKKTLRVALSKAANDGLYQPPFILPTLFEEK